MVGPRVVKFEPSKHDSCIKKRNPWVEVRPCKGQNPFTSQCNRKHAAQKNPTGDHIAAKINHHRIFLEWWCMENKVPPKLEDHDHDTRQCQSVTTAKHQKPREE